MKEILELLLLLFMTDRGIRSVHNSSHWSVGLFDRFELIQKRRPQTLLANKTSHCQVIYPRLLQVIVSWKYRGYFSRIIQDRWGSLFADVVGWGIDFILDGRNHALISLRIFPNLCFGIDGLPCALKRWEIPVLCGNNAQPVVEVHHLTEHTLVFCDLGYRRPWYPTLLFHYL